MSKKISGSLKLIVPSCKANPSPPIGPALGQRGVNIMEFCKQFNEKTKQMKESIPLPVVVTVYNDRSFTFVIKKPSTSYLIKSVLGKRKQILASEIIEIAKYKNPDLQKLENTTKMIIGTLKSMAIKIEFNL